MSDYGIGFLVGVLGTLFSFAAIDGGWPWYVTGPVFGAAAVVIGATRNLTEEEAE